jgi:hypothetical protein
MSCHQAERRVRRGSRPGKRLTSGLDDMLTSGRDDIGGVPPNPCIDSGSALRVTWGGGARALCAKQRALMANLAMTDGRAPTSHVAHWGACDRRRTPLSGVETAMGIFRFN